MARQITGSNDRGTWFMVTQDGSKVPAKLSAMATLSPKPVAVRFAGGCSGWDAKSKAMLQPYMLAALKGYAGVAMSGGTASGIAKIPAWLAETEKVIALGTFPRTHDWSIADETGDLLLTEYKDTVDRGQHAVAAVQLNADKVLDWDGDLELYFGFLTGLRNDAGWKVGVVVMNGGAITKKEIAGAIDLDIPLVIVKNTGRAADEFLKQYDSGEGSFDKAQVQKVKDNGLVAFADYDAPATLTHAFQKFDLM